MIVNSFNNNTNLIFEYFNADEGDSNEEIEEYDQLKRAIIQNKFIDLKNALINFNNSDCFEIIEFISLTLKFFNQHNTKQLYSLLNNLVDIISKTYNIQVPERYSEPEEPQLEP
jgi:hypothetical protein